MGKKGGWFSAVRRAFYSDPKDKKDQRPHKSKRKWFGRNTKTASDAVPVTTPGDAEPPAFGALMLPQQQLLLPSPPPPLEALKLVQVDEGEQSRRAYTVALATAVAAEAAVAAAEAAAEVVRLTSSARYPGKSKEEVAAIRIQIAFRGYMARRALRALRGLVRLKTLIKGQSVKRQAATTLRCMQMLARLQSQVRARRIRMSEDNQALQRQLQQKQEKEFEKLRMAEKWNASAQSKEQMEENLLRKQEAAIRRERALAYTFSHQKRWKNTKSASQTFMDPNNPHWGWSWMERWMASRPWGAITTTPGKNNDRVSMKSEGAASASSHGEIHRSYSFSRPDVKKQALTAPKPSRAHSQRYYSPSTPTSNDSRSIFSIQSEIVRRQSIAGSSSARDDESLTSTATVPSYMTPTKSARAKSRAPSPLRADSSNSNRGITTDKGVVRSARKRLSFPSSPASVGLRRHTGPPPNCGSIKGVGM
ncbi:hypothetical protein MLD38_018975 [Melastoma candidum]|uniref:Uncharacterized protein n=1 Tax=Melastoma candidum TaxID=119954 RepID=A0ACB9QVQ3_9MYRT|nr:hypothetical protein MLD38_018975 [Melastoma candidum]